jgi:predicted permease
MLTFSCLEHLSGHRVPPLTWEAEEPALKWFNELFTRRRRYEDLSVSIQEHFEEKTEELVEAGMSREEAARTARREFGNVSLMEQRSREVWQWPTVESVWADVKFASRQLRKSPGFTAAALFTLALGIGADTAVFSLFDTVFLHPLPYRDPGSLMLVTEVEPGQGQAEFGVAIQEAQDYKGRSRTFAEMGTFESGDFNLTDEGEPLRVNAALVSHSVFPLLGVSPILGRTFAADEDRYGNHHVAVLSAHLWKSKYGGDPGILGKTIKLDEAPYLVIGVMPASFRFPFDGKPLSERADIWVPDVVAPTRLDPQNRLMEFGVGLIGRLKPGVSEAVARTEMTEIADAFQREHPDVYTGTLRVEAHTHAFAGYSMQKARPLVLLLMAAVTCVLLIACANVANLLLARASRRRREISIRAAVGANRMRLVRQCLVESLVLAAGGAALGVSVAEGLLFSLRLWGPRSVPRLQDATLNPQVLLFTLAVAVGTGILFGLVPAWKMSHVSPHAVIKDTSQVGTGHSGQRLLDGIAIVEVALAMVLLISGGLLLRSFVHLVETPSGFDPSGTLVVRTNFDRARYPQGARRKVVQRELLQRFSHLPGVTGVAAASHLPLSDERQIGIRLEHSARDDFHWAANSVVSPGYFRTMGIPLLRGRDFSDQDRPDSVPVAVVSQAFVNQYLPGPNPLGQRFYWGDRSLFTVIGVAQDVHIAALDADPPPMVYHSMFQIEFGASSRTAFLLRGSENRTIRPAEIQSIVWSVDRDLPLYDQTSLSTLVEESRAQRRFTLQLLGTFAACALILAAVGLFGVMSYLVEQREREFGLHMALGADRNRILILISRKGLLLGMVGCLAGLVLSALSTRLLGTNLYHVNRFDPVTFCCVPCLLLGVAMLAVLLPARRAASVDPMKALRSE